MTVPIGRFDEADYRYGIGTLIIQIETVDWANPQQHDGEEWYSVIGVEFTTDGRVIGRRQALIKARRLSSPKAAVKRPSAQPT